ncbi:hypothetical protein D1872_344410 [compost metagenome]
MEESQSEKVSNGNYFKKKLESADGCIQNECMKAKPIRKLRIRFASEKNIYSADKGIT